MRGVKLYVTGRAAHRSEEVHMTRTIYVTCPNCKELLEVDAEGGKVVKHFKSRLAEKAGSADVLTDIIKDVKSKGEKLDAQFKDAKEKEKEKSRTIDDVFKKSIEKAKRSKDNKPGIRPFDLD
jgi:septal ring factor EnvC (AmiA/AmiB activator)